MCKSFPVPNIALSLSANSISLPLLCKSPPSCGDVSDTTSVVMLLTVVLSAAISTPSTVPVTEMFPVTSRPAPTSRLFVIVACPLSPSIENNDVPLETFSIPIVLGLSLNIKSKESDAVVASVNLIKLGPLPFNSIYGT